MSLLKTPENNAVKNRRIPNAFMLFVRENKTQLLQKCPMEDRNEIGAFIGRTWKSMTSAEKQVYFDKYNALKKPNDDKHDLNSDIEEKITEDEEISMEMEKTNGEDMASDREANKISNKPAADNLADGILKKHRPQSPTLSDIGQPSSILVAKQKPLKKSRRPPNAFMLFANEKRGSLDTSATKDKKCHANAVLGGMWRELPDSEKAKYLAEARRLMNLHKKSETTTFIKNPEKTKKVRFKVPKKSLKRISQQKKEVLQTNTRLRSSKANDLDKSETESKPSKPVVDKCENKGSTRSSTEPPVPNEPASSNSQQQHNTSKCHSQRPKEEPHQSNHCCCRPSVPPCYSHSDAIMSRSCLGAGFFPPMFPTHPFNMPFSMYQQAMTPPMFPFPSMGFPPPLPSLCGCSSPYFYNSTYYNAYSSLYAGGVMGSSSYESHSIASASATHTTNKEASASATHTTNKEASTSATHMINNVESAEGTKATENSEDETLVVDESSDGHETEASNHE